MLRSPDLNRGGTQSDELFVLKRVVITPTFRVLLHYFTHVNFAAVLVFIY